MRPALLVVLTAAVAAAQPPAATDPSTETAHAAESAALARKVAEDYAVRKGKTALKLEPKSLLKWSNPVHTSIHGSVFVWTDKGRPEVIASIYKNYPPVDHLGLEFHSLSSGPVTARGPGGSAWEPAGAGVTFRPVPGAPAPASTAAGRLRQLRALATEFSAGETTRQGVTRTLRLLTQPVHRYESADPDVLDGALFAFVEGTDPEIFLALEARRGGEGSGWRYAPARMNSIALRVSHKGREVWGVPTLSWDEAKDPRQPYALFTFKPGEGPNPAEPPADRPGR